MQNTGRLRSFYDFPHILFTLEYKSQHTLILRAEHVKPTVHIVELEI